RGTRASPAPMAAVSAGTSSGRRDMKYHAPLHATVHSSSAIQRGRQSGPRSRASTGTIAIVAGSVEWSGTITAYVVNDDPVIMLFGLTRPVTIKSLSASRHSSGASMPSANGRHHTILPLEAGAAVHRSAN